MKMKHIKMYSVQLKQYLEKNYSIIHLYQKRRNSAHTLRKQKKEQMKPKLRIRRKIINIRAESLKQKTKTIEKNQ